MAITYVQAFPPKWYIVGLDGLAAGGAQLFTYDSLTRLPRAAFQDPGGFLPYTNPIIFDLNGTRGPIYFQEDSTNPTDLYYIEAYDSQGNLLWTANDFPSTGSGGGGNVTSFIPIVNYIANNQFINHIVPQAGPLPTNIAVAPSNHKGFTPALINPIVGTYGVLGPDIRFIKNNTNAVDSLSFPVFPLSGDPLTGDVTPVEYVRYQCTNTPTGETYKNFQFPITQKVKNLANQIVTFGVWAAVTTTPVNLSVYVRQYFGSGTGASTEVRTLVNTITLTTTWTWYPVTFTIPTVAGKSLGTPGLQTDDDALYIQLEMPLGAPCDVLFIKPALFLGAVDPELEFESYDMIDSIDQTPRCGDIRMSYFPPSPLGWLPMNDTSIGNIGSLATNVAGAFTFQLYKTLWDGISNTYAPVSGGRGASAVADFLAGKTLTLPSVLGRALAVAGSGAGLTPTVLGQASGVESTSVTLVAANLPPHAHTGLFQASAASTSGPGPYVAFNPVGISTGNGPGTSTPFSVPAIQPSSYLNVYIKY